LRVTRNHVSRQKSDLPWLIPPNWRQASALLSETGTVLHQQDGSTTSCQLPVATKAKQIEQS